MTKNGIEKLFAALDNLPNNWTSIMIQRSNMSIEDDLIKIIKCRKKTVG